MVFHLMERSREIVGIVHRPSSLTNRCVQLVQTILLSLGNLLANCRGAFNAKLLLQCHRATYTHTLPCQQRHNTPCPTLLPSTHAPIHSNAISARPLFTGVNCLLSPVRTAPPPKFPLAKLASIAANPLCVCLMSTADRYFPWKRSKSRLVFAASARRARRPRLARGSCPRCILVQGRISRRLAGQLGRRMR